MSYPVRRTSDPSGAPNSSSEPPTTATVLDYICLFTHDLRRKQKRWQDGKLKYHTFNKRIMVYDDRGNFIGDAHWHEGGDLEEGAELNLDRGAAIVQVADCVGSREQDLTEVLDKRAREVEKRRAVAAAKTPTSSRARPIPQHQDPQLHFQLSHRRLSSIVASPGPIGRAAIPNRSPYEARKAEATPESKPAQKRRISPSPPSKAGFAQNLFGARLNLGGSGGLAPSGIRALKERTNLLREGVQQEKGQVLEVSNHVVTVDERRSKVVVRRISRSSNEAPLCGPMPTAERAGLKPVPTRCEEGSGTRAVHNSGPRNIRPQVQSTAPALEDVGSLEERPIQNKILPVDNTRPGAIRQKDVGLPTSTKPDQPQKHAKPVLRDDTSVAPEPRSERPAMDQTDTPRPPIEGSYLGTLKEATKSPGTDPIRPKKQRKATSNEEPNPRRSLSPLRPPEKRTELRIRPRQRRGLLMVSERRQEQQRKPGSVTSTFSIHSANAGWNDSVRRSESPKGLTLRQNAEPERQQTENTEQEQTIEATPEPNPPHYSEPIDLSGNESDATHARMAEPLREEPKPSPDSDPIVERLRKRRRISFEGPANVDSPSEGEPNHSPPKQKKQRRRNRACRYDLNSSGDEEGTVHPLPRSTRKPKAEPVSDSPLAEDSSEEDLDQASVGPARRSGDMHNPTPLPETKPERPRITRLARKGVKCKEILGFIPSICEEELVPAPFAMANGRIGTVGRPPIAPTRLPGITLTRELKPVETKLGNSLEEPATRCIKATDHPCPGAGTTTEPMISLPVTYSALDDVLSGVTESRSLTSKEIRMEGPVLDQSTPCEIITTERGTAAKPTISNPASRGKKAARKEDAAGQPPQAIVPFEAPQPARPTKPKAAEPKKAGQTLPGFASANGGAWSKHAEDLLGMTRPTRKRPV